MKLNTIDDFTQHPFKVLENEELQEMSESIKETGILSPVLVREKQNRRYEMFYDQEDNYKALDDLTKAIDDYIYYYNYARIKVKLKGLSPVNYRLQSSN